jgi:hypothetical protein
MQKSDLTQNKMVHRFQNKYNKYYPKYLDASYVQIRYHRTAMPCRIPYNIRARHCASGSEMHKQPT